MREQDHCECCISFKGSKQNPVYFIYTGQLVDKLKTNIFWGSSKLFSLCIYFNEMDEAEILLNSRLWWWILPQLSDPPPIAYSYYQAWSRVFLFFDVLSLSFTTRQLSSTYILLYVLTVQYKEILHYTLYMYNPLRCHKEPPVTTWSLHIAHSAKFM